MKLALSGIAAAVMLTVLPAAQAADSGQGGRQARQQQRVAPSGTATQSPRTYASRSADQAGSSQGWNRGRSGSTAAGGSTTGTTTTTTTTGTTGGTTAGTSGGHHGGQNQGGRQFERHAQHNGGQHAEQGVQHHYWNQGGRHFERHAQHNGGHQDNGRHYGWTNGNHHGWDNGRGNYDSRGSHSNINQREAFQRNRIAQGVRSGELTRGEARALQFEQRRIENIEQNYRSDGRFTREERADIQRRLDRSAQHIYQETHDADRRY